MFQMSHFHTLPDCLFYSFLCFFVQMKANKNIDSNFPFDLKKYLPTYGLALWVFVS